MKKWQKLISCMTALVMLVSLAIPAGIMSASAATTAISDFTLPHLYELYEGNNMTFIVEEGTDVTSLAPTFTIDEGAVAEPASGTTLDFTAPVKYTVTAGSSSRQYTVTVVPIDQIDGDEKEMVEIIKHRIDMIPDVVTELDRDLITLVSSDWNAVSKTAKMLMPDESKTKLADVKVQLNRLTRTRFRISCIGSSTTEGAGSSNNSLYSYPAQLQKRLGGGYQVLNYGVSGTTVASGVGTYEYVSTDRYRSSLTSSPDMVLMFVGSNDAVYSNWNRTDIDFPALFRECYVNLMQEYMNLDTHPVVVVCYPYRTFGHTEGRDDLVPNAVIPMLDEIAAEYDCPVLDLYTPTSFGSEWSALMPDGLHPNDDGYTIVAAAAEEFIDEYHDTELSSITAGDEVIETIPGQYDYGVVVDGNSAPVLSDIIPDDPDAVYTVEQAEGSLPATATITVTSFDEAVSRRYTVTFANSEAEVAGQEAAGKIAAIDSAIILDSKDEIDAARAAYDALDASGKAWVFNLDLLEQYEAEYETAHADSLAAAAVEELIADLEDNTGATHRANVENARAEYDKLTAAQKKLVGNVSILYAAEAAINEVDQVGYVNLLIEGIIHGDYRDSKNIRTAREVYDKMTDEQKAQVTDYAKLTAAEAEASRQYDAFDVTVSASTWRDEYASYPWMNKNALTEEERNATAEAMADELRYQYVMEGYAMGKTTGNYDIDSGWGSLVLVQLDNIGEGGIKYDTDNVGNPWGHGGRYWSMLMAPFKGMAFSQKGYFGLNDYQQPALGNSFVYEGRVYQIYWNGIYSHEDVALVPDTTQKINIEFNFPGADFTGTDITDNAFRYAAAKYNQSVKWESKTIGMPAGSTEIGDDFYYQPFIGPDGVAYIAGQGVLVSIDGGAYDAYTITGALANAFVNLADDDESRFEITGSPVEDAVFQYGAYTQKFENGILRVDADGVATFGEEEAVLIGDLDNNGTINVGDVVALRQAIMNGSATEYQKKAGDLDGSGVLNVSDVVSLRQKIMEV